MTNSYKDFPRLLRTVRYDTPPNNSCDFRSEPRPIASVACVINGEAEYVTEGRNFHLSPGDLLFVPIGGTYISYWNDSWAEFYAFHFMMRSDVGRRYLVQRVDGSPELTRDFTEAVEIQSPDLSACERFYRILGKIWNKLESVDTNIDPRIRPALEFLENSPERECSVSELATLCNMSESHFYPCFRKSTGLSPMEYRKRMLVMKAERLLGTTEMTISEIAYKLGFGSETYFRRVFKSATGKSPRTFRKTPLK